MEDIKNRLDIETLINRFYRKVLADAQIGYIFTEVAFLDLERHMPVMYSFWETALLGKSSYRGNPMEVHIALHRKSPLEAHHFRRWLELWEETLGECFEGPVAGLALERARQIAGLMEFKLKQLN